MHEVLVNRLGGLSLSRKSVVRLTDRPDMTLDVYRGRKTTMQQIEEKLGQTAKKSSELPRCDRVGATNNKVEESEPKPGMSSDVNLDSPDNDTGLGSFRKNDSLEGETDWENFDNEKVKELQLAVEGK